MITDDQILFEKNKYINLNIVSVQSTDIQNTYINDVLFDQNESV